MVSGPPLLRPFAVDALQRLLAPRAALKVGETPLMQGLQSDLLSARRV